MQPDAYISPSESEALRRRTILVIESYDLLARAIARIVVAAGYGCALASSIEEAETALQGGQFELVLIDVDLHDTRPLAFAYHASTVLRLPVVVMSSDFEGRLDALLVSAGLLGIPTLAKPFSSAALVFQLSALVAQDRPSGVADDVSFGCAGCVSGG